MDGLEQTFYIMAIIFMSLTFLMIIALVSAVFVIRSKINHIHESIESKFAAVSAVANVGSDINEVVKQAKKTFQKK